MHATIQASVRARRLQSVAPAITALSVCCFAFGLGYVSEVADASEPSSPRLTAVEAASWRRIDGATLTPDGNWLIYQLDPANLQSDGAPVVVIRSVHGEIERRYDAGVGGGEFKISPSGHWLAFRFSSTGGKSESPQEGATPVDHATALIEVTTGRRLDFPGQCEFSFGGKRDDWFARRCPALPQLSLVNLSGGVSSTVDGVLEYAFNPEGSRLAWISSGGVYVRDLSNGNTRLLDTLEGGRYERLTWSKHGGALAVLRRQPISAKGGGPAATFAIVAVTGIGTRLPRKVILESKAWNGFPHGFDISSSPIELGWPRSRDRARDVLTWRDDETGLFFGIRAIAAISQESSAETAGAPIIWRSTDPLLPRDKDRSTLDQQFSYLSYVSLSNSRFIRLADETVRDVEPERSGSYLLGYDSSAYDREYEITGHPYRDYYVINITTGRRTPLKKKLLLPSAYFGHLEPDPQISPDGAVVLYLEEGNWKAYELSTGITRSLTQDLPVEFMSKETLYSALARDDDGFPAIQGWTRDGQYVLVWDRYDIWALPLRGGRALNLTANGRRDHVRYVRTEFGSKDERYKLFPYSECSRYIDLTQAMYFRAFDMDTRRTGLAWRAPGGPNAQILRWEDANVRYQKASGADVYITPIETAVRYPDMFLLDSSWNPTKRLTDANPQQRHFSWSPGARLLSYATSDGEHLQGVLHLPADYQSGKMYPGIVSIYQLQSQDLHEYRAPTVFGGITVGSDIPRWTEHGYAVFEPDIQPRSGEAGPAALRAVLAGVTAMISTGIVDPGRLGLEGHSYGGYETDFIVTQTHIFKAAVSKAAFVNLWSAYGGIYESRQPLVQEVGQPYISGPWWQHWDQVIQNSPLFHARNITTPLLLIYGDEDKIIPFTQATEFFNTLRAIGDRSVVLLEYPHEGHSLVKPENLQNATNLEMEFYDYLLKGGAIPLWWRNASNSAEIQQ